MKYFVTIGSREHVVTVEGESVSIDGETLVARIEKVPGTPLQVATIGTAAHRVLATRGESRTVYRITVDGRRFEVDALNERAKVIRELGGLSSKPSGPAPLIAPMPGLIVRINAKAGDQVRAGQGLVIMEAMKMENELRATSAGTVRTVHVSTGSAVEKGALLLELE